LQRRKAQPEGVQSCLLLILGSRLGGGFKLIWVKLDPTRFTWFARVVVPRGVDIVRVAFKSYFFWSAVLATVKYNGVALSSMDEFVLVRRRWLCAIKKISLAVSSN
jgi:hypothetical protein